MLEKFFKFEKYENDHSFQKLTLFSKVDLVFKIFENIWVIMKKSRCQNICFVRTHPVLLRFNNFGFFYSLVIKYKAFITIKQTVFGRLFAVKTYYIDSIRIYISIICILLFTFWSLVDFLIRIILYKSMLGTHSSIIFSQK